MKRLQITSRYLWIIAVSILLGVAVSLFAYSSIKKAAAPEERVEILMFSKAIEENTVLTKDVIKMSIKSIDVPISLKPRKSISSRDELYDMTIVENVRQGEYLTKDMLTKRGSSSFDAEDYWQVSIDVSELTNFLGLQLKRGERYQLFYRAKEKDRLTFERDDGQITDKAYVVELIDHLGNKVFEERDENIKSVVLAVEDEEAALKIVSIKDDVSFELIKAPVKYYKEQVKENNTFDQDEIVNEILKEKQDRRRYM